MRLVFLDTETTGLAARGDDPHRIVEAGAIEMIDWRVTGEEFHRYVNPERDVPEEARRIHGLSREFLRGHPTFAEIYDSLRDFIGEDQAVIHNAPFDLSFLSAECDRLGLAEDSPRRIDASRVIDTLELAREKFPGGGNSLDALCRRFGIDAASRDSGHGALIDARLLAQVYVRLAGGTQQNLLASQNGDDGDDGDESATSSSATTTSRRARVAERLERLDSRLSESDRAAHDAFVDESLGEDSVWRRFRETP